MQAERNNLIYHSIWPHLTFVWPFINISLTIHPTHNKLYIFVILTTSPVIWYTWKAIWSILKIWPPLDPCVIPTGKGQNRPKVYQNIFWPITTSKPSITHFSQNGTWVLLPLQSSIIVNVSKECVAVWFWHTLQIWNWQYRNTWEPLSNNAIAGTSTWCNISCC